MKLVSGLLSSPFFSLDWRTAGLYAEEDGSGSLVSAGCRTVEADKMEPWNHPRAKRRIRMNAKQTISRFFLGALLGMVAFCSLGSVGCTVFENGMTLPNPHYMNNRVQYFPSDNEFQFSREAANMQAAQPDHF